MVRMVTTSNHTYAGRPLTAGDEFDCEPQHVILMTVRGCARRKDDPAPEAPKPQEYQTRHMEAGGRRSRKGKAQ